MNETKLHAFERIFDWYGFNLTSVQQGVYVPNCSEYAYNEAFNVSERKDTGSTDYNFNNIDQDFGLRVLGQNHQ
ncbi:hypothetical protein [Azospirillum palustre]